MIVGWFLFSQFSARAAKLMLDCVSMWSPLGTSLGGLINIHVHLIAIDVFLSPRKKFNLKLEAFRLSHKFAFALELMPKKKKKDMELNGIIRNRTDQKPHDEFCGVNMACVNDCKQ